MTIFIEIITVLWQAFWGILKAFGTAIWDNLPAILEIKKVMGYSIAVRQRNMASFHGEVDTAK